MGLSLEGGGESCQGEESFTLVGRHGGFLGCGALKTFPDPLPLHGCLGTLVSAGVVTYASVAMALQRGQSQLQEPQLSRSWPSRGSGLACITWWQLFPHQGLRSSSGRTSWAQRTADTLSARQNMREMAQRHRLEL